MLSIQFIIALFVFSMYDAAGEAIQKTVPSRLQTRSPGEYIITANTGLEIEEIKLFFPSAWRVLSVQPLANMPDTFLVKFQKDPGLEVVAAKVRQNRKIRNVQPNFIYRAF